MRLALGSIAVAMLIALMSATGATAEVVGDGCVANDQESGWTAIVLNNAVPNSTAAPVQVNPYGGVITRWRIEVGPGEGVYQQQLVVLQQVAEEEDRRIGESALENVVEGVNEFTTRIPAPPYAHVGLHGPTQTYFCDKTKGHLGGIVEDPFATGETRKFKVSIDLGVPVQATVEPDRDADGYGDLSQDGCPALTGFHDACPDLNFAARKAGVKRGAILIAAKIEPTLSLLEVAQATVKGGVSWPAGGKARAQKVTRVDLSSDVRTLTPGVPATLRMPLPKRVTRKLAKLAPSKFVKAEFVAEVVNGFALSGSLAKRHLIVRLHGWAKPVRRGP